MHETPELIALVDPAVRDDQEQLVQALRPVEGGELVLGPAEDAEALREQSEEKAWQDVRQRKSVAPFPPPPPPLQLVYVSMERGIRVLR